VVRLPPKMANYITQTIRDNAQGAPADLERIDLRQGGPPLAGRHPIIEAGGSGWWGIPLLHTNQDGSVLAVGDRRGWRPTRGAVATRVPPKGAVDRAVRKVDLNRVSPGRAGSTVGDRTEAGWADHRTPAVPHGRGPEPG